MPLPELGIYIHIPFCKQKCTYCDFISFPNQEEKQEKYIQKLLEEIEQNKELISKYQVTTIYIGGGTPSYINSSNIVQIINTIQKNIKEKIEEMEVTIEVNPGTVTKQKLNDYKKSGINRLSIGLQTTNDELLKTIGRIHNYKEFLNTYQLAREVGFENINVDLMIGLPNQTIKDIKDSLKKVIDLKPEHISIYSLIVEPNTPMEKMIEEKTLVLPTEEEERKQYHYVKNQLELHGYEHYEISNFAIPKKQAKHNLNCWEQKEYIGFGISAHSYINKKRYSNTENLEEYLKGDIEQTKTIHETQEIEDQKKEYILLGLRKLQGVQIVKFKEKFGENPLFIFRKEIEKLVEQGLIEVDLDNILLTQKGLDFANLVWEEFI